MAAADAFRAFEHAGWNTQSVAVSYHRHLGELTRGCIPQLMRATGLKAGDKVLDVACGPGYVAAAARERGANVVGLDFSAAQIAIARQACPGVRFVEGDAEALPFADAAFDTVSNAFGMPHLANPERAAAEAYRVLKPGGRFCYASWCEPAKCIGFAMVYEAIRAHGSLDVGLPPGPNFFSCGDPAYATDMLGRAGFMDVAASEAPLFWRVRSPDEIIAAILSGGVRAAAVLRRQTAASLARIRQYLEQRVVSFRQDEVYAVPTPALVVRARKPG